MLPAVPCVISFQCVFPASCPQVMPYPTVLKYARRSWTLIHSMTPAQLTGKITRQTGCRRTVQLCHSLHYCFVNACARLGVTVRCCNIAALLGVKQQALVYLYCHQQMNSCCFELSTDRFIHCCAGRCWHLTVVAVQGSTACPSGTVASSMHCGDTSAAAANGSLVIYNSYYWRSSSSAR